MATVYHVEAQYRGKWVRDEEAHETMTEAEIAALDPQFESLKTRVVPVDSMETEKISAKRAFRRYG